MPSLPARVVVGLCSLGVLAVGPHVACTRAPAAVSPPAATLHKGESWRTAGPDGGYTLRYGPIFLGHDISRADGVVYVHALGVHIEPGSEAAVLLVDGPEVDASRYIGGIATVEGMPSLLPIVTLEINDAVSATGEKLVARSALRESAKLELALQVRRGSVSVDRFVVTTSAAPPSVAAPPP